VVNPNTYLYLSLYFEAPMRRFPFAVPGMIRLTSGGGSSVVDRLRGAMEPLVMAVLHRFDAQLKVQAVNSGELHTLSGDEYPKEWWVRTAFVPQAAPEPEKAKEMAWLTIEYSQWEDSEEWVMQAFFRVSEVEFSLHANSAEAEPILNLVATRMPSGDIQIIEELLRAHFGGPASSNAPMYGTTQHTICL
jgi:hypothetical protein